MRSLLLFLCAISLFHTVSAAAVNPEMKKLIGIAQKMLFKDVDDASIACTGDKLYTMYCKDNKSVDDIVKESRALLMKCVSTEMYGPGLAALRQMDRCFKLKDSNLELEGMKVTKGIGQCTGNMLAEIKKECATPDAVYKYVQKKFAKEQIQKCINSIKKEMGRTWECARDNKLVDFKTQKFDV